MIIDQDRHSKLDQSPCSDLNVAMMLLMSLFTYLSSCLSHHLKLNIFILKFNVCLYLPTIQLIIKKDKTIVNNRFIGIWSGSTYNDEEMVFMIIEINVKVVKILDM